MRRNLSLHQVDESAYRESENMSHVSAKSNPPNILTQRPHEHERWTLSLSLCCSSTEVASVTSNCQIVEERCSVESMLSTFEGYLDVLEGYLSNRLPDEPLVSWADFPDTPGLYSRVDRVPHHMFERGGRALEWIACTYQ